MEIMNNFNESELLVNKFRGLIVEDCCKQYSNVQNCGLLLDLEEDGTVIIGFANVNNKKESWRVKNFEILKIARKLQEAMNKEWVSLFFIANLESDKFNISFLTKSTMTWRKSIFDAESEWRYYEKMLENYNFYVIIY